MSTGRWLVTFTVMKQMIVSGVDNENAAIQGAQDNYEWATEISCIVEDIQEVDENYTGTTIQ